jgi:hypothetical protein
MLRTLSYQMPWPSGCIHTYALPFASILLLGMLLAGCGSGASASGGGTSGTTPSIVSQPGSQSVPMGLTATFSVVANGSSLKYQWSKDSTPIDGATNSTYITPATAFSDTGENYSVTVSNSLASVTSSAAELTVTARAPKSGDLRFQQVDAASTVNGYSQDETSLGNSLGTPMAFYFSNAIGTPLSLQQCNPDCGWEFLPWTPPSGTPALKTSYLCDYLQNLQADLSGNSGLASEAGLGQPNTVITSLSTTPGMGYLGMSSIQSSQTGPAGIFDLAENTVAPGDFQAAANQEGAQSRVITAVSSDADGNVFYLSYGWQGDATTVYETKVATATIETVNTAATALATAGYIITAIGELDDHAGTVILVGTRVQGDTLPRSMLIVTWGYGQDGVSFAGLEQGGYAPIGILQTFGNSTYSASLFGER